MTTSTRVDEPCECLPSALLRSGVPLTLLLDLVDPRGPRSEELYRSEEPAER